MQVADCNCWEEQQLRAAPELSPTVVFKDVLWKEDEKPPSAPVFGAGRQWKNPSRSLHKAFEHTYSAEEDDWGNPKFVKCDRAQFAPDGYFHVKVDFLQDQGPALYHPGIAEVDASNAATEVQQTALVLGGSNVRVVSRCPKAAHQASGFDAEARHCTAKMLSNRPGMFDCSVNLVAGAMEVRLDIRDQHLLQQLPFLQDLISNAEETDNMQGEPGTAAQVSAAPKEIPFNPPCSFWGLVCLLLLLENKLSPEELFGDCSTPPSLPSETLQMARFLCSRELETRLVAWLKKAARAVCEVTAQWTVEDHQTEAKKRKQSKSNHDQNLHFSEVLQLLPDDCVATVVAGLFDDTPLHVQIYSALALPKQLLQGWLQTLVSLDLRGVPVALADTCRLLYQLPVTNSIRVLHVDLQVPIGQHNSAADLQVRKGIHSFSRAGALGESSKDLQGVLMALEAAVPHLGGKLRVLGIHGIGKLSKQHCLQLSRACMGLANSVTAFSLSFAAEPGSRVKKSALPQTAEDKRLLFKALSRLSKLSVLAVPQWEALVGSDTGSAVPLAGMRCLKSVLVDGVPQGGAFDVPGLKFKTMYESK